MLPIRARSALFESFEESLPRGQISVGINRSELEGMARLEGMQRRVVTDGASISMNRYRPVLVEKELSRAHVTSQYIGLTPSPR